MKRVLTITKKILWQIKNDKRTIGMIIVMPVILMYLFGISFTGQVEGVKVIIIDQDNTNLTKSIISNFNTTTLSLSYGNNVSQAENEVQDGEVWAVIVFPKGFSENLEKRLAGNKLITPYINISIDKSSPTITQTIYTDINNALSNTIKEKYGINATIISFNQIVIYGKNVNITDYITDGMIGFVGCLISFS